jgi:hypothetical protein
VEITRLIASARMSAHTVVYSFKTFVSLAVVTARAGESESEEILSGVGVGVGKNIPTPTPTSI